LKGAIRTQEHRSDAEMKMARKRWWRLQMPGWQGRPCCRRPGAGLSIRLQVRLSP
jgi:hypothetical protein